MLKRVCLAVGLISICGCGGSGGSSTTSPNTPPPGNTPVATGGVSVTNNAFSPAAKTVAAGTAVQWSWNSCTGDSYSGQTCVGHSVTFDDGTGSGIKEQGSYN